MRRSNVARLPVAAPLETIRSIEGSGNPVPMEYDSAERLANVFLYTCPPDGAAENKNSYKHWCLVFQFTDGSWRTAEGKHDENNIFVPSYTKESPIQNGSYYEVGELITSPAKVRECILKNQSNGKSYLMGDHSDRDWVLGLAAILKDGFVDKIKNYDSAKPVQLYRPPPGSDLGRKPEMILGTAAAMFSMSSMSSAHSADAYAFAVAQDRRQNTRHPEVPSKRKKVKIV